MGGREIPALNGKRERYILLALIFSAAMGLRLAVVAISTAIELDGIGYATVAEQFSKGLFGRALTNVFPPVYPLFIGLFHLAIPDVELAGRLVSLVCSVLTIYVSFLFARRLLHDGTKAVWVAFLLAIQPYLVRYSGAVLSESLAVFLFSITVFAFYAGWREERRWCIVVSGLCLTLTYLTRPEYVVFYAPFIFVLSAGRRVRDSLLFLLPFLILGLLYICYLRFETGLWMISKKATMLPFVRPGAAFRNVPFVAYEFFIAIFPLFFVFALFGVRGVEKPYRNLVFLLAVFHVASLSFVSHATRRYSVEFIPISMIFVVEGIYAVKAYLTGFFRKGAGPGVRAAVTGVMVAVITAAALFQAYAPPHAERALHKKAGLFLLHYQPGSVVASRLPLVAFYEKGTPVDLLSAMSEEKDLAHFKRVVAERKVDYLVFDEQVAVELPFLNAYLTRLAPVYEVADRDAFVRVYRL
jgi:hypothetical protein